MKALLSFLSLTLLATHLMAQGTIISLTVSPQNPTVNDMIVVYAQLQFSSSDCAPDYQGHSVQGNTIGASAHHCMGMLTTICSTTDTFEIGQLPAGNYTFDFTLSSGFGGSGCSPGIVPDDSDQLQFTVSSSVGIEEVEMMDGFVYPNPVMGILHLRRPLANTITITDAVGRVVKEMPAGSVSLDVSDLRSGIYMLRMGDTSVRIVKE